LADPNAASTAAAEPTRPISQVVGHDLDGLVSKGGAAELGTVPMSAVPSSLPTAMSPAEHAAAMAKLQQEMQAKVSAKAQQATSACVVGHCLYILPSMISLPLWFNV
jgi:hypothetical protein